MPTTIPYDPSLVLGSIVSEEALTNLTALAAAQAPIDAAQDTLNSLISVRRSLDMTVQELMNLNIPTEDVLKEINILNKDIEEAGKGYAQSWVENIATIKELKSKQLAVHVSYESPVDYNKSGIKPLELSSDSLKLEAQYFSLDSNSQSSQSSISDIQGFISRSVSALGKSAALSASVAATSQVSSQLENHDISGTLVISVTCTHRGAKMLAPFIMDVDKAIRVWNQMFTSDSDKIKTNSISEMQSISAEMGTQEEKSIKIISGGTLGSCFIGMVHILNNTSTSSYQSMNSLAASLQVQFKKALLFSSSTGGFGIDASFSNDIKNMLSSQQVTSHVSLVTMGIIPSIKSNEVKSAVKEFANFDGATIMNNLAQLNSDTSSAQNTALQDADKARSGEQMVSMQSAQIKGVFMGLQPIDEASNRMLDINSMMTAFDDYITRCGSGIGLPINYYIKPITRSQLASMWIAKYFPGQYLTFSGDDSGGSGSPAPDNNNNNNTDSSTSAGSTTDSSNASTDAGSADSSSAGSGDTQPSS